MTDRQRLADGHLVLPFGPIIGSPAHSVVCSRVVSAASLLPFLLIVIRDYNSIAGARSADCCRNELSSSQKATRNRLDECRGGLSSRFFNNRTPLKQKCEDNCRGDVSFEHGAALRVNSIAPRPEAHNY
eukprot:scaffold129262_cov18-Prasinocladus_malaysianus.AAC.1